jgi:hypothetical protein
MDWVNSGCDLSSFHRTPPDPLKSYFGFLSILHSPANLTHNEEHSHSFYSVFVGIGLCLCATYSLQGWLRGCRGLLSIPFPILSCFNGQSQRYVSLTDVCIDAPTRACLIICDDLSLLLSHTHSLSQSNC